jgi:hypothetical protein
MTILGMMSLRGIVASMTIEELRMAIFLWLTSSTYNEGIIDLDLIYRHLQKGEHFEASDRRRFEAVHVELSSHGWLAACSFNLRWQELFAATWKPDESCRIGEGCRHASTDLGARYKRAEVAAKIH